MEPCERCGAALGEDADGFIKLRRPAGIPDAAMGSLVAQLYGMLLAAVIEEALKEPA